jgi:hypothetical protein
MHFASKNISVEEKAWDISSLLAFSASRYIMLFEVSTISVSLFLEAAISSP